jgi:hypothetical protein
MNASCARHTPEVRVVGSFPLRLAGLTPATPGPANKASVTGLKLAADGAAVLGDAIWHWYYGDGVHGFGLRGGTEHFAGPATATRIVFHGARWTIDTAVYGHALWDQVTGYVRAWLTVSGPGGSVATVRLSYHDYVWHSVTAVSGSYRGKVIAATMPSP